VGVSRQTLHAVFGTKDALGQALVLRVTDRFLVGVAEVLDRSGDQLGEAVTAAVTWTLLRADEDPMVHTVLTSSRTGGDTTMLPLLATSEPLLHRATDALQAWICGRRPDLDTAAVREVVDTVVRLVVSHTVVPVDPPEVVGRRLGRLAERELGPAPVGAR
jgi:AcrR family transcriptional regulator